MFTTKTLVLLLAALATTTTINADEDLCVNPPPVEINGKHFYNSETGDYFPIKGIAYYPRPNSGTNNKNNIDKFTNDYEDVWTRDILEMREMGVNVVRIYAVDPGENHDNFFCALKRSGIYAIIGLAANCLNCAISNVPAPDCYHPDLRARGEYIISVFSKYDNVIGFSAGNEVGLLESSIGKPEVTGTCQKKFIRDMRAYVQSCPEMRSVPIGVVIADESLEENSLYYGCRSDPQDELENAEWLGLNQYRSCDGTAQDIDDLTGYQQLLEEYQNFALAIPVIFTEFGCRDPSFSTIEGYEGQRTYLEVNASFTDEYLAEFTGGVVFEYSTELSNSAAPYPFTQAVGGNFGVVYFTPEDCDDITTPCEVVRFPEFEFLKAAYNGVPKSLNPPPTTDDRPEATECPAQFTPLANFTWEADDIEKLGCPQQVTVQCDCSTPFGGGTTVFDNNGGGATTTDSNGSEEEGESTVAPTTEDGVAVEDDASEDETEVEVATSSANVMSISAAVIATIVAAALL